MKVNCLPLFTEISHNAHFVSATLLTLNKFNDVHCILDEICDSCRKLGFHVHEMCADQEFKKSLETFKNDKLNKSNDIINVKHASAKEHAPRAAHNNRTIKERARAAYYQLPHNHLPKILVEFIVMECAKKLN